jgi:transcriptional regulator with XRE-family HTH domain
MKSDRKSSSLGQPNRLVGKRDLALSEGKISAGDPILSEFGARLRQAMLGKNPAEIAKSVGVSRSSYYTWLAGKFEPSLSKLAMLASITNVNLDWLITGRGRMHPDEQPGYLAPSWRLGERPPVLFELDWFRKNAFSIVAPLGAYGAAHLFEVPDDSMEPTLKHRDLVLARDLAGAAAEAPTNGVYLVWFRDRAITDEKIAASLKSGNFPPRTFPRRIVWSENSFLVKCDNFAAYPDPIKVTAEKILSTIVTWRVVWHGRLI